MFYLSYKRHVQCGYIYHALYGSKVVRHENVFNVKSWTWSLKDFGQLEIVPMGSYKVYN
jgi:hypothetical protein